MSVEALREAFSVTADLGADDSENVVELLRLCKLHNLTAEALHNKWESFSMRTMPQAGSRDDAMDVMLALNADTLTQFRLYLQSNTSRRKTTGGVSIGDGRKMLAARAIGSENAAPKSYNKLSFEANIGKLLSSSQLTTPRNAKKMKVEFAPGSQESFSTPSRSALFGSTPTKASPMYSGMSPNAQKFLDRTNSGRVEVVYNASLPSGKSNVERPASTRVEVAVDPDYLCGEYRYMYDKVVKKSQVTEERINEIGQIIATEHEFADEVSNPNHPSQGLIRTYGRVCSASAARLNEGSLILESSRSVGLGGRVNMNVSSVESYSLFPGQIVGFQGVNNMGRNDFLVAKTFLPSVPEQCSTTISELYKYNFDVAGLNGEPMHIVAAAGPFTLDDSMSYEPLESLLQDLEKNIPDVLILTGPFVDDSHPMVADALLTMSLAEYLQEHVIERLLSLLRRFQSLQVLLVPSTHDAFHPWCCMPQPPIAPSDLFSDSAKKLQRSEAGKSPQSRLISLPNPCVVSLNEIVVGICSSDILFHLCGEEISRTPSAAGPSDRVARLAKHLLQQRSFYPLSPGHPVDGLVDSVQLSSMELNITPDIMILPSMLGVFAKSVEKCVVVNPGFLCRRQAGGTFARFAIQTLAQHDFSEKMRSGQSGDEAEDEMYHGVDGRAKVEIIRL